MDKGIYTALSGGLAKARELELIANNLANVNTPGFKRDTGTFNEYLTEVRRPDMAPSFEREITAHVMLNGRPSGDKSFVEMDAVYTDFKSGGVARTGQSLDLALKGDGFFEVLTPSGVAFTRQGNFSISAEGKLVTANGFPVLARGVQSADLRTIQLLTAPLQVTQEGILVQNGLMLAQLSVTEFAETQWLEKIGNSYFRNTDIRNVKNDAKSEVMQGFLEGSNVNPVSEMTRLIEATRAYESHMQAVKTYQEIDNKTANELVTLR